MINVLNLIKFLIAGDIHDQELYYLMPLFTGRLVELSLLRVRGFHPSLVPPANLRTLDVTGTFDEGTDPKEMAAMFRRLSPTLTKLRLDYSPRDYNKSHRRIVVTHGIEELGNIKEFTCNALHVTPQV